MPLVDLENSLKSNYFSPPDNIAEQLYKPCLRACENGVYYRGAGYFRSSVLSLLDEDLINFCKTGGKMHLLTSTDINPDDYDAAFEGYSLRELNKTIEQMLEQEELSKPTRLLCALVASKKLEIHVAILPSGCIYHDKMGFFQDSQGNTVAFAGSGNESRRALHPGGNFERFSVSCSWESCYDNYGKEWKKVLKEAIDFHIFEGAEILTLDEIDPKIIERHNISTELDDYSFADYKSDIFDYGEIHHDGPQPHQIAAIHGWIENGYRAGLQHATGTYKTATGLLAAEESLKQGIANVVITTPRMMISDNWAKLAEKTFSSSVRIIQCWSEHDDWQNKALDRINSGKQSVFIFVNDSLWGEKGRTICRAMGEDWCLIVDEAHNWEAAPATEFMGKNSPTHRLGLSAQFADPMNPGNISTVLDYLALGQNGHLIDELNLSDAIEQGFLREYEYELKPISIEESVFTNPRDAATDINRRFRAKKKDLAAADSVNLLLEGKQRVLSFTGNSTDDAKSLMTNIQKDWNDRSGIPIQFKKVTCLENRKDRLDIINEFNYGRVRGLIAINVLDEGVDLPIADAAVMTTSKRDHRQWIQRRGRILRKIERQDKTKAKIIDYVLDISDFNSNLRNALRDIGRQDLQRILEFADSSDEESRLGVVSALTDAGWMQ